MKGALSTDTTDSLNSGGREVGRRRGSNVRWGLGLSLTSLLNLLDKVYVIFKELPKACFLCL